MTRTKWIGLGLLAVLALTAALLERSAARDLRQERETLLAQKQEAEQLAQENRQLAQARAQLQDLEALRAANRDLPRLRNEIRQLRAQQKELEKLQADNQRLAAEIQSGSAPRRRLADMEGYVARETLANAGFSTPEATVQTFFWAMRETNVQALAQCLPPQQRDAMLRQFAQMSPDQQKRMAEQDNPFSRLKGYRISEKTSQSDESVVLGIQVATDGEVMKLPLRRYGQEWKIENF